MNTSAQLILDNLRAMRIQQEDGLRHVRFDARGRLLGLGRPMSWRVNERRMVELMTGPVVFARAFARCVNDAMWRRRSRVLQEVCDCSQVTAASCSRCLFTRSYRGYLANDATVNDWR